IRELATRCAHPTPSRSLGSLSKVSPISRESNPLDRFEHCLLVQLKLEPLEFEVEVVHLLLGVETLGSVGLENRSFEEPGPSNGPERHRASLRDLQPMSREWIDHRQLNSSIRGLNERFPKPTAQLGNRRRQM
ncbi:MAG: hypothetical protein WBF43_06255, partial [Methylocella sp.]